MSRNLGEILSFVYSVELRSEIKQEREDFGAVCNTSYKLRTVE